MHTTSELLDLAKSRHGVSDWKLSSLLDVVPSAVKNYRAGRSLPDDAVAERLADLSGMDVHYVLACVHAQRAKDAHTAAVWRGLADRLAKATTAAAVFVVALGVTGSPDARAAQPSQALQDRGSVHYVNPCAGSFVALERKRALLQRKLCLSCKTSCVLRRRANASQLTMPASEANGADYASCLAPCKRPNKKR